MADGVFPEAWEQVALVTVEGLGLSPYQFAAVTETIDISEPDYPGEGIPNIAGGRIWKQSPQEDGEVTLELYPIELTVTTGEGLFQQFAGGTQDSSDPKTTDTAFGVGIDRARNKFMIAILWTQDIAATSAVAATTTSTATALRFYAKECRITSHKASFTDGVLKVTATFKFPAMNVAGDTRSYAWESTKDCATTKNLPALSY